MVRIARVVLVLGSATALAAPGGRVVRVERSGGQIVVRPRLCQIRGDGGTCIGDEPKPGQAVVVLDDHRVVSEVQVGEARATLPGCDNLWTIKTRALRGITPDGDKLGVIDPLINPSRARVVDKSNLASPSGQPGDEVWHAIDRDGDGVADILVIRYTCDVAGRPVAGASTFCIDIWARAGQGDGRGPGKLSRMTQLNFGTCNI
jgi:hypothetical protein